MMYFAIRFYKKSGKIDKTLTHDISPAMLKMWGLTNTTAKSKDTIVFDSNGKVLAYYEGTGDFPKVCDVTGEHIDKYCPGLLEACLKDVGATEEAK